MIKASEGGGGKGIRKCTSLEEFATQFRQVQAEVPGSPIFLMKLAESARHLEVQVGAKIFLGFQSNCFKCQDSFNLCILKKIY
jgi:acetyl/propionyl-CoA carboxylase alpha subunit